MHVRLAPPVANIYVSQMYAIANLILNCNKFKI